MAGSGATAERRLVVNADDFGMTTGITDGILEAFEAGALRSTSIMAGMPAFDAAARAARVAGPALGVGIHFTLTLGRPLTRAPSLTDARGDFLSLPRLVARLVAGRVAMREIAAECRAQIAACRAAGLALTHLDGHEHVHVLPGVRAVVDANAVAERIRFRRRPRERLRGSPFPFRRLPARLLLGLPQFDRGDTGDRGGTGPTLRSADTFLGLSLFGATRFADDLLRQLDALPAGTSELMVHPGRGGADHPPRDHYVTGREVELRALTSVRVLERLHRGDIQLRHFGTA